MKKIAGDGDVDQRWRFFVLCSDASYSDGDVRKKQRCDGDWKRCYLSKMKFNPRRRNFRDNN